MFSQADWQLRVKDVFYAATLCCCFPLILFALVVVVPLCLPVLGCAWCFKEFFFVSSKYLRKRGSSLIGSKNVKAPPSPFMLPSVVDAEARPPKQQQFPDVRSANAGTPPLPTVRDSPILEGLSPPAGAKDKDF
eukprot:TRINITY_DN5308_c0_g1_i1.p1 TRINITY_DN5308_c0_g1~~TRINITY_DN5308_c0_g1_i1.p1  ORF type:complete len:134 (-),score=17.24 TRINITY_DN5308_c0_g1_i1:92-493(-)